MGLVIRLAELLIVILPLAGMVVAAVKAFTAIKRRTEGSQDFDRARTIEAASEPTVRKVNNQAAQWRSLRRVIEEHGRTDARWLEYELDLSLIHI